MPKLLLLFIVVPAVELALLIEVGRAIGTLNTLVIIALTGVFGAALARWQGGGVLRRLQDEVRGGQLPAASIMDGVLILIAAALLVTPGILTDVVGFLCLIPRTRQWIRSLVLGRLRAAIQRGTLRVSSNFGWPRDAPDSRAGTGDHPPHGDGPVIDVTPEPREPERETRS